MNTICRQLNYNNENKQFHPYYTLDGIVYAFHMWHDALIKEIKDSFLSITVEPR